MIIGSSEKESIKVIPFNSKIESYSPKTNRTTEINPTHPSTTALNKAGNSKIILLTGFEPFGGNLYNSSWEAVKALDNLQISTDVNVVSIQLPVLWDRAGFVLQKSIDQYDPIFVINVGQGGNQIALEQFARNHAGRIPDNKNLLPPSDIIIDGGLLYYQTKFNLEMIQAKLKEAGIHSVISSDAGDYLCNFASYYSYSYLDTKVNRPPTMFIHVPPIYDPINSDKEKLEQIVQSLKIILISDYEQFMQEIER